MRARVPAACPLDAEEVEARLEAEEERKAQEAEEELRRLQSSRLSRARSALARRNSSEGSGEGDAEAPAGLNPREVFRDEASLAASARALAKEELGSPGAPSQARDSSATDRVAMGV